MIAIIGGIVTNSTAILADAVHDLGDSFTRRQVWRFLKDVLMKKETSSTPTVSVGSPC
ncbi:hypothetical protein [Prosthecochloris sp.]|uniref:hypothetical protein n=1 Tax=Prosthecochloris sp. TaxID=290513 RepID=UPI0025CE09F3|nr:hypothetical protein [Prosthecochloris sp.]